MPMKASGLGTFEAVDDFDGGFGWLAHPEETMQRASHALIDGDDIWLVDPVDAAGLDERLADVGTVAGVVVLFNHHRRDAAALAARHDVSVYLPSGMTALSDSDIAAPVKRFEDRLAETGYYLRKVTRSRLWQEWALFDGETLAVAESVGTAEHFRAPGERLGVALPRRLVPPRATFGSLDPKRVLCGHGEGVFTDAAGALHRALKSARRTAPRMYLRYGPTMVRSLLSAVFR